MDVQATANLLLNKHGLAQQGWRFKLDHARRRAGQCSYRRRTISLSKHYVALNLAERPEEVLNTILHEIAHALAGPHTGHGPEWKATCLRIGAKPERCYRTDIVKMPGGRLTATCGGCARTFTRHRNVRRNRRLYCVACGPEHGKLDFRTASVVPTTTTPYVPPQFTKLRGT